MLFEPQAPDVDKTGAIQTPPGVGVGVLVGVPPPPGIPVGVGVFVGVNVAAPQGPIAITLLQFGVVAILHWFEADTLTLPLQTVLAGNVL